MTVVCLQVLSNDSCVSAGIVAVSVIFSVWLEKSPANPTVLRVHWQWILRYV